MTAFLLIPNFPKYSITKWGDVWSHRYQKWLKSFKHPSGYLVIDLWKNGKRHACKIHRLVLQTYIGPCPEGMECRHLDGVRSHNYFGNLKWGTRSENVQDAIKHGTFQKTLSGRCGEKNYNSKLTDQDRRLIFSVYHDGIYTQQELANHFEVSQHCIKHTVNNKRWGGF